MKRSHEQQEKKQPVKQQAVVIVTSKEMLDRLWIGAFLSRFISRN